MRALQVIISALILLGIYHEYKQRKAHFFTYSFSIWKQFSFNIFTSNLVLAFIVAGATYILMLAPPFRYGWSNLIFQENTNVIFSPISLSNGLPSKGRMLGNLLFFIALLTVVPHFVRYEEKKFRAGVTSKKKAIINSAKFGLIHLILGIPLGAAMAITIIGWYYATIYRKTYLQELVRLRKKGFRVSSIRTRAGKVALEKAIVYHANFNTIIIVAAILFYVVLGEILR